MQAQIRSKMKEDINMRKVIVTGGGASGLTAAVFAARNGNQVTILEHKDRVGKKILMTGNGRCNLTNMSDFHGKYYSSDEKSLQKIYDTLVSFGAKDARGFFESMGLYTKEKKDGCVYPVSEQASAVLDVLRCECDRLGVRAITGCEVHSINPHKSGGRVSVRYLEENGKKRQAEFSYDKLILATGGKAAPVSGSDGLGYQLAQKLGHKVIKPLPALVQLRCEGSFFKAVSGVRAQAGITLYIDGKASAFEEGELQLTDYGISGIPVFQFSRMAARALDSKKRCEAGIHFLPYVEDLERFIKQNVDEERYGYKTVEELLGGMVHKKIASMICKKNKTGAGVKVSEAGKETVRRCILELADFRVKITGANPFEHAQVCSGGVPLGEV
ncbi:MAG: aminoacetone oxidase family FAD-binding enzyme, partial [Lachnospiraceae bacterium]|nr:aminoacetone oxidase family FAD-binding enzyme [Lachnospiraceae bacterium]